MILVGVLFRNMSFHYIPTRGVGCAWWAESTDITGFLDSALRTIEHVILLPDVIIMDDAAGFYGTGAAVTKDSKYPEIKPASIPTAVPTINSLVDINLFCDLISCILFSSIVSINS